MPDFVNIFDQLIALDLTPILLALVLGGAVGLEREMHGRPAGLRTHMLVCVCSTVLMLASRELSEGVTAPDDATIVFDPQRLAAGIVTGIGFLGAAAVVRSGDIVRGLTTGACIWGVAGLGVVLGQGAYGLAVGATLAYLFVLTVLAWLPTGMTPLVYRRLRVHGDEPATAAVAERVRGMLKEHGIRVQEVMGEASNGDGGFILVFHVRYRDTLQTPAVLDALVGLEGVVRAEWAAPTD